MIRADCLIPSTIRYTLHLSPKFFLTVHTTHLNIYQQNRLCLQQLVLVSYKRVVLLVLVIVIRAYGCRRCQTVTHTSTHSSDIFTTPTRAYYWPWFLPRDNLLTPSNIISEVTRYSVNKVLKGVCTVQRTSTVLNRRADGLGRDNCPHVRAQLLARPAEFAWRRRRSRRGAQEDEVFLSRRQDHFRALRSRNTWALRPLGTPPPS